VAALLVARDARVSFSRFASEEDLAMMRGIGSGSSINAQATTDVAATAIGTSSRRIHKRKSNLSKGRRPQGNYVFVVHGRNEKIRKALFGLLRSVGVQPIEWNKAIEFTKKGAPYVGEILDAAFKRARAIVVLFTPDDEAKLKGEFVKRGESGERSLSGQPRPNVLFEAGMAFGRFPNSTVLVHVGKIRAISDVAGRHLVNLTGSIESRHQLIVKLRGAGCAVDDAGNDWQTEGDFTLTKPPDHKYKALYEREKRAKKRFSRGIPRFPRD
jgi:predicted nucleotide-binding protein